MLNYKFAVKIYFLIKIQHFIEFIYIIGYKVMRYIWSFQILSVAKRNRVIRNKILTINYIFMQILRFFNILQYVN